MLDSALGELHLVHALTSVPVKEGLAAEHGSELLGDALEELLDGGGVTDEGGGHLEATGGDVADSGLDVVGDPLDKVARVLVLDIEHLLVDLLHGHAATEHACSGQVATMTRIGSTHHVLGVELLLGQFGNGQSTVLLRSTRRQRHETNHEKVQTRERNQVHSHLAQVSVQLTREAQAGCHTRHGSRHQVVQVTVCWGGQLERSEANVIQSFVVHDHALVRVLNKLVHRKSGVVGFHNGVRHLW